MRTSLFSIALFIFTTFNFGQELKKGSYAGNLKLSNILNAPSSETTIKDLSGKIIILEFWATWCGPCIPALDHLAELKKEFGNDLVVIGIAYESEKRIKRFIENKPLDIWQIADKNETYKKYFHHRKIPHTVIIDKKGVVAVTTSPTEITKEILNKIKNSTSFTIKEKRDVITNFDYTKDYFPVDKGVDEQFIIQPKMENGMKMIRKISRGEYKERRITFINNSILNMIKYAFDIVSDSEYEVKSISDKNILDKEFCFDAIAPMGTDLKSYLKRKIKKEFPLVGINEVEKEGEVLELVRIPGEKLAIKPHTSSNKTSGPLITNITSYKKKGVTIDDFVTYYLRSFISPILKQQIVNGTNIDNKTLFDFDFEIQVEDSKSFKKELAKLGLKLSPKKVKQNTYVLYEKY